MTAFQQEPAPPAADGAGFSIADAPPEAAPDKTPFSDEWKDHRDCHIEADLVLIHGKSDAAHLDLE